MKRWHWLILAVLCALALAGTRYIGVAIVCGAAVFMRSWRDRIAVCALPVLGQIVGHVTGWSKPYFEQDGKMLFNLLNIPAATMEVAAGAYGVALAAFFALVYWRESRLPRILWGVVLSYLAGLTYTVIVNRYNPAMNERLFLPVTAALLIIPLGLAVRSNARLFYKRWTVSLATFMLIGLAVYTVATSGWKYWLARYPDNKFLNSAMFDKTEAFDLIREHVEDSIPVYTNNPYLVWLKTGINTKSLPYSAACADTRNNYVRTHKADVIKTGGLLVWFKFHSFGTVQIDEFIELAERNESGAFIGMNDTVAVAITLRREEE